MKQSLQLKLGQQLTMTPQLQQAIKLLQLSTLDLQQEIQQALESNPMLDVNEESDSEREKSDTPTDSQQDFSHNEPEPTAAASDDWQENIPSELPVDTRWDDVYQASSSSGPAFNSDDGDFDIDSRNTATESLQDHLRWQLNLTRMSDTDRLIAMAIIDAIDTNGRLTTSAEDIHAGLHHEQPDIELDEVMAVLHRIQQFDPPGIAGQDLQECLLIQLNQLSSDTPWLKEAKLIVSRHLNLLGNRDYAQLMRRCRLKEPQLMAVLKLIQQLNPSLG